MTRFWLISGPLYLWPAAGKKKFQSKKNAKKKNWDQIIVSVGNLYNIIKNTIKINKKIIKNIKRVNFNDETTKYWKMKLKNKI
jgi:hypothetical protein